MDAFDNRMQTFGGRPAMEKDKNFDKYISEKRGFLRTSNGFSTNDPMKLVEREIENKPVKNREFVTTYDNKYKQTTSFATDAGRVKEALKPNRQNSQAFKNHEKAIFQSYLKNSNIRFMNDEFGPP